VLVRDFMTARLAEREAWLEDSPAGRRRRANASVECRVEQYYRNMREVLDAHPQVVDAPARPSTRAGLEVRTRPIRGGTDGSRLSFMGLPTPNIFAGEQNFHSRLEWVSTHDMQKAVEVIVLLARVWEERS